MVKPTKHMLIAAVVIGAASAPSTAYAAFIGGGGRVLPPAASASVDRSQPQQAPLLGYQRAVEKQFGSTPGGLAGPVPQAQNPARRTARSSSGSFQWGDAGVGAAGLVVLLGAGAGAASAMRRRRVHRVITG